MLKSNIIFSEQLQWQYKLKRLNLCYYKTTVDVYNDEYKLVYICTHISIIGTKILLSVCKISSAD